VDATPVAWSNNSWSLRASAGVFHHVLAEPLIGDKLRGLRPARHQLRLPLRDRRPIVEPPAARRRVAAQLPRDGQRVAAQSAGDLPHPRHLSLQYRDLLALLKRQVPASEGREHERGHAATLPDQRLPAACDAPTAIAASSLVNPLAISRQYNRSTSRRSDGLPGDFIGALPVSSVIQPAGLPISTSTIEVLRRPVESAPAWNTIPAAGSRAATALVNASATSSVRSCSPLGEPDHPTRGNVDHGGQLQPPFPGREVGDVTTPAGVDRGGVDGKVAADQVCPGGGRRVRDRGPPPRGAVCEHNDTFLVKSSWSSARWPCSASGCGSGARPSPNRSLPPRPDRHQLAALEVVAWPPATLIWAARVQPGLGNLGDRVGAALVVEGILVLRSGPGLGRRWPDRACPPGGRCWSSVVRPSPLMACSLPSVAWLGPPRPWAVPPGRVISVASPGVAERVGAAGRSKDGIDRVVLGFTTQQRWSGRRCHER
jgi:hypothetical protein